MTKEELLKKDWQLLTASSLIKNNAYLRTIIENQSFIISKLTNIDLTSVTKQMNKNIKDNTDKVNDMVKNNIPEYPPINDSKF